MTTAYYHEDDEALIQLIPEENLLFIWPEFEEIIGYDIEKKINTSTSETFSFENLKIMLLDRKIEESELIQVVNLPIVEQVFTGYSTHQVIDTRYKAFFCEGFKIFYSIKNDYVDCIWLLYNTFVEKHQLASLLFILGNKWKLCLATSSGAAVNLQNQDSINQYFDFLRQ
jgi:hypothetical protein